MRLFTGIAIPQPATARMIAIAERLRPLAELRWSPPAKLHVTTTFIGEWPEDRLPELISVLDQVPAALPGRDPVEIDIRRVGVLPSARFPRLVYAGVAVNPGLQALAEATSAGVARLGVAIEKRIYRPHVTLARVRGRPKLESLLAEAESVGEIARFHPDHFHLYLSRDGVYERLRSFAIAAAGEPAPAVPPGSGTSR